METPVAFWLVLLANLLYLITAVRLSTIDIKHHLLPNRIVFPFAAMAGVLLLAASLMMNDGVTSLRTIIGAVVLWAGYMVLRLISPSSMGYGDVKLAFVLGLYLGFVSWQAVMWGTVMAFLLGAVWGLVLILSRRGTGKTQIPFGPFMLAGASIALVAG